MIVSIFFLRAKWVKVNGTKYQTPCVLVVGTTVEEEPVFGNVTSILVSNQEVYFQFEQMESYFIEHLHAHCLSSLQEYFLVKQTDLINYHLYGIYHCSNFTTTPSSHFIVLRHNIY